MYNNDFVYIDQWCSHLRDHQVKALEALKTTDIGQIIIPTGAGKTRIQITLHVQDMIDKSMGNKTGVYVIAAHRLLLCQQLVDEFIDLAVKCGLNFNVMFIGTLNYDIDAKFQDHMAKGWTGEYTKCDHTTRQADVDKMYWSSRVANRHLIIVSTYHSFSKLKVIPSIDICTYDEAHTTTAEDFTREIKDAQEIYPVEDSKIVNEILIEEALPEEEIRNNVLSVRNRILRNYFFTATRKASAGSGMNDTEFYGEILYSVSPRAMIDAGEIVEPKLHMINTIEEAEEKYSNTAMMVKSVIQGFKEHSYLIKNGEHGFSYPSAAPDKIEAKILVCCNGTDECMSLHDDPVFREFCDREEIQVFCLSSIKGYWHKFMPTRRSALLKEMRSLKDTDRAILIHIRILTEGIDLPSITGVMPFKDLNPICLFQTLGRAARLLREDRDNLYSGNILPNEVSKFIKPYCWLILPLYYKHLIGYRAMISLL